MAARFAISVLLIASARASDPGLSQCTTVDQACLDTSYANITTYHRIGDPDACCTLCNATQGCAAWTLITGNGTSNCTLLREYTAQASCGPPGIPYSGTSGYLAGAKTHYGNPYVGGCLTNEFNYSNPLIEGGVCAPPGPANVAGPPTYGCPKDVPFGSNSPAYPVFVDSVGIWSANQHCALVCRNPPSNDPYKPNVPSKNDTKCGDGAYCAKPYGDSGIGVCVYKPPAIPPDY